MVVCSEYEASTTQVTRLASMPLALKIAVVAMTLPPLGLQESHQLLTIMGLRRRLCSSGCASASTTRSLYQSQFSHSNWCKDGGNHLLLTFSHENQWPQVITSQEQVEPVPAGRLQWLVSGGRWKPAVHNWNHQMWRVYAIRLKDEV